MQTRLVYSVILIVLVLIGITLVGPRFRTPTIDVTAPERGPAVQAIYATGTVEPTAMLPISARSSARLLALEVDEGSAVKKGDVLARLENEELQQSIEELRVRQQFHTQEFGRQQKLVESKVTSSEAFERAKADLHAARAATRAREAQASYFTISAPADGTIIKRDGEVGQLIQANEAVFWFSTTDPLRISAEVDEEDIPLVKPLQKVLIRSDAFIGSVFEGEVQSITPKGDPILRSYRVRISLKKEVPLRIGMTAENNIVIREATDAILIPSDAVVQNKVWVLHNETVQLREIEVGARGVERTEVLRGLSIDELVVANPGTELKEGDRVHPRIAQMRN